MSIARASSRPLMPTRAALRRVTIVSAVIAAGFLLFAAPALAHIRVTPESVPAGSTTVLTFHVPDEEAKASTVKLDVLIPTAHPIAQLLVEPVPGWTSTVKTITLPKPLTTDDGTFNSAVSEVTWSGGKILPGQFQDFAISCDSLPADAHQLVFKAVQTYSNGDIVRWIDLPQPGQPEPDHPAPVVKLTTSSAPAQAAGAIPTATGSSSDAMARALGLAGLVVGLVASLLALTIVRRDRRLLAEIGAGAHIKPSDSAASTVNVQAGDRVLVGGKVAPPREQPSAASKAPAQRNQVPARANTSAKRRQSRRRG